MSDPTEIEALKASLRGVASASQALSSVAERVQQVAPGADVAAEDLEELSRLSLANAIAAQALRGLVNTMLARRGLEAG